MFLLIKVFGADCRAEIDGFTIEIGNPIAHEPHHDKERTWRENTKHLIFLAKL
jgi:hypothetical protein